MDLDLWDTVTRAEQEASIGRRLSDGSPLTGGSERDDLDLTAASDGRPAISLQAHAGNGIVIGHVPDEAITVERAD